MDKFPSRKCKKVLELVFDQFHIFTFSPTDCNTIPVWEKKLLESDITIRQGLWANLYLLWRNSSVFELGRARARRYVLRAAFFPRICLGCPPPFT